MIEVERKFRLIPEKIEVVRAYLKNISSDPLSIHQIDSVYLYRMSSFKDFKLGDPVIRIRSVDEKTILTYKKSINKEGDRIEHELTIDSASIADALLKELGFNFVIKVEKDRSEYKFNDITFCLDDVSDLGIFLEIEIVCQSNDEVESAQKKIMKLASQIGFSDLDLETRKYDQLLSDKNI